MELRLRGGFPRANAVRYVKEQHGVNVLANICAIDRAALPALMDYWVPGTKVMGVHELLGNALVMDGEIERTLDLRLEELPEREPRDGSTEAPNPPAPDDGVAPGTTVRKGA
jgi:hypothetical protein